MAAKKCSNPARVVIPTLEAAKRRKAYLTTEEVAQIMSPTWTSFEALRKGEATDQDWAHLSEAGGIGVDLSTLGICSDQPSRTLLFKLYYACGAIADRANASGRIVATGPELNDIREGLDRHEIQLAYTSADDLMRAVESRKKLMRKAKTGKVEVKTLNLCKEVA